MPLPIERFSADAQSLANPPFMALVTLIRDIAEGKRNGLDPESVVAELRGVLEKVPDEVLVTGRIWVKYTDFAVGSTVEVKHCIAQLIDLCDITNNDILNKKVKTSDWASESEAIELAQQRLNACEQLVGERVEAAESQMAAHSPEGMPSVRITEPFPAPFERRLAEEEAARTAVTTQSLAAAHEGGVARYVWSDDGTHYGRPEDMQRINEQRRRETPSEGDQAVRREVDEAMGYELAKGRSRRTQPHGASPDVDRPNTPRRSR